MGRIAGEAVEVEPVAKVKPAEVVETDTEIGWKVTGGVDVRRGLDG